MILVIYNNYFPEQSQLFVRVMEICYVLRGVGTEVLCIIQIKTVQLLLM